MDSDPSSDTLPSGHQIAGYTLVRFLGRGAMGEVYEAMWNETGVHYALKLLSEEMMNQESAVERFQREAEIMAALDHPCIAKVMDWGFDSGRYWLCIELLGGMVFDEGGAEVTTLDDFIRYRGGKLPQEEVQTCMGQFLDALNYAHGKGLVHRDLKPANILLCDEGMKIADFGLVDAAGSQWMTTQVDATVAATVAAGGEARTLKLSDSSGRRSSEHALLGTFAYMSPEQKKGWAATAQSDLYAAGLVCFYMLTGEASLGLEMPSEIDRNLWKGWDEFIGKALKTRPQDRFDDAGKMYAALSSVSLDMHPEPVSPSAGYGPQSSPPPKNSRRMNNPAKRNIHRRPASSSRGSVPVDHGPPPKSIKRIGICNLIIGILGLVSFPYNILIAFKDPLGKFQHLGDAFQILEVSIYGVNLLVALFCLISGIGLLSKHEWGRVMAIACAWMTLAMSLSVTCLIAFELIELKSVWSREIVLGAIGGIVGGFVFNLIYFCIVISSMGNAKVRIALSNTQELPGKSSSGLVFGLISVFLFIIFITASIWVWVSGSFGSLDLNDKSVLDKVLSDAVDMNELIIREEDGGRVAYTNSSSEPYTGWVKTYSTDGSLRALGQVKEGIKDGRQNRWHSNGQMETEFWIADGKINGSNELWYSDGKKRFETTMKNGKFYGPTIRWWPNGKKQSEGSYLDGEKPDGEWSYYYESGVRRTLANYKDGKRNGAAKSWYRSGSLRDEITYSKGKVFKIVKWKPNGEKCKFTKVSSGVGVEVDYGENGVEIRRRAYNGGELVD